jgi:hypothetical protein
VLLFIVVVVLFHLLNSRAARVVGERWGIDAATPGPRLAIVIALDLLILVAFGVATGAWAALALLPIAATIVMVVLRAAHGRSQPETR